jgi:hypothetical protein
MFIDFIPNFQLLKKIFEGDKLSEMLADIKNKAGFSSFTCDNLRSLLYEDYKISNEEIVWNLITLIYYIEITKIGQSSFDPVLEEYIKKLIDIKSLFAFLESHKINKLKVLGQNPSTLKNDQFVLDNEVLSGLILNTFIDKAKTVEDSSDFNVEIDNIILVKRALDKLSIESILAEIWQKKKRGKPVSPETRMKKHLKKGILNYLESEPDLQRLKRGQKNYIGAQLFAYAGLFMREDQFTNYQEARDKGTKGSEYKGYKDYLNISWNMIGKK